MPSHGGHGGRGHGGHGIGHGGIGHGIGHGGFGNRGIGYHATHSYGGYGYGHYSGGYGHLNGHYSGHYSGIGHSSYHRRSGGGGGVSVMLLFPRLLTPEQAAQAVASNVFEGVYAPPSSAPGVLATLGLVLSSVCIPLLGAALGTAWKFAVCRAAPSGDSALQFKLFLTRAIKCPSWTWASTVLDGSFCEERDYDAQSVTFASLNLTRGSGIGATVLLAAALLCALPLCLECCGCCCAPRAAPMVAAAPPFADAAARLRLNALRLFRLVCGAVAAAAATALGVAGLPDADVAQALRSTGACYALLGQGVASMGGSAPGPALALAASVLFAVAVAFQGVYFAALRGRWAAVAAAGGAPLAPPALAAAPTPLQLVALRDGGALAMARQLGSWTPEGKLADSVGDAEFVAAGLPASGAVPAAGADLYGAALALLSRAPLEGPAPPPGCVLVPMVVEYAGLLARVVVPVKEGDVVVAPAGVEAAVAAAPPNFGGVFGSLKNVLSWRGAPAPISSQPPSGYGWNGGPPAGFPPAGYGGNGLGFPPPQEMAGAPSGYDRAGVVGYGAPPDAGAPGGGAQPSAPPFAGYPPLGAQPSAPPLAGYPPLQPPAAGYPPQQGCASAGSDPKDEPGVPL